MTNHADPIPEADAKVLENGYPEEDKEELRELIRTHADLQRELVQAVEEAERVCDNLERE
jgi:ribosomal 50S subunit-associated protein YjgA (DUF615 family)